MIAWLAPILGVIAAERLTASAHPLVRMLAICAALLYGMKVVALAMGPRLPLLRALAFTFGWFGMRTEVFLVRERHEGAGALALRGAIELGIGLGVIALAFAVRTHVVIATLLLLPGLSLTLHFGIFNLVAAFWRWMGFDTGPLFRAPLAATNLAEFWSRRWNLAFSEMTARLIYIPLKRGGRGGTAIFLAFLFSGVLHELAISLPVRAAFGLPTLYFLLHGLLVAAERRGLRLGRAGTLLALALPLPLCFHPPFVTGVLWPLIGILPA